MKEDISTIEILLLTLLLLSTVSDYVKNGSGMLLIQLASGFSVG